MKTLSLIGAALLVAGCGSDGGSYTAPPPTPDVPPVTMLDAFFTAVSKVVSAAPDDTEANDIDALVATAPEDSEPASL